MVDAETLRKNLERVTTRMAEAARRAGRAPEEVRLLAVTKTWPVEVLERVVEAGIRSFGENRVQELEEKVPALPADLDWHLIGHLQKNKARKAVALAGTIHSLDSLALARRVDRIAREEGRRLRVYWQVKVGGEQSKTGFDPDELRACAGELGSLASLHIEGLMAIPPFTAEPDDARRFFVELREFRDQLARETGTALSGLSMGMSHDFEVAIEEGATIVRVGSALFGPRT